jgi:hypothetical protein
MAFKTYKSKYTPVNKEKYVGDISKIICRSSWERHFIKWLDHKPQVVQYSSEELVIPYFSPIDKKMHRYYPDFLVQFVDEQIWVVEIKPFKETKPPEGKNNTRFLKEACLTYVTNEAKWNAAIEFCKRQGWNFKVITENELLKLK